MFYNNTWAYRLFRYHHIQLNEIYWSYAPVANDALKLAKTMPPATEPADLFKYLGDNARRIPHPLSGWEKSFKESQAWMRLSLVMAIASILEVYLRTAVTLAIESDPGLLIGAPGVIDGVKLLKSKQNYSYLDQGKSCVNGEWKKRLGTYRSLFGSVPKEVEDSINDLEQLRMFRNGVGHTFGRDAQEYTSRIDVKPKPLAKVSEDRLQKWLEMSEKVVKAIDQQLGSKHIGEYEALYFYHIKVKKVRLTGHTTHVTNLMKELKLLHGHGPGKTFCKELIEYYNKQ